MATQATERKSAEVRREEILEAAMKEFAYGGLHGTSTEKIAARAGISQPYLFRLFGTKKELFIASSTRCFGRVLAAFQEAAEGKTGYEAKKAMGGPTTSSSPTARCFSARCRCTRPAPTRRSAMRRAHGFAELFRFVEQATGPRDGGDPRLLRDGDADERGRRHGPAPDLRRRPLVGAGAALGVGLERLFFWSRKLVTTQYQKGAR